MSRIGGGSARHEVGPTNVVAHRATARHSSKLDATPRFALHLGKNVANEWSALTRRSPIGARRLAMCDEIRTIEGNKVLYRAKWTAWDR